MGLSISAGQRGFPLEMAKKTLELTTGTEFDIFDIYGVVRIETVLGVFTDATDTVSISGVGLRAKTFLSDITTQTLDLSGAAVGDIFYRDGTTAADMKLMSNLIGDGHPEPRDFTNNTGFTGVLYGASGAAPITIQLTAVCGKTTDATVDLYALYQPLSFEAKIVPV